MSESKDKKNDGPPESCSHRQTHMAPANKLAVLRIGCFSSWPMQAMFAVAKTLLDVRMLDGIVVDCCIDGELAEQDIFEDLVTFPASAVVMDYSEAFVPCVARNRDMFFVKRAPSVRLCRIIQEETRTMEYVETEQLLALYHMLTDDLATLAHCLAPMRRQRHAPRPPA